MQYAIFISERLFPNGRRMLLKNSERPILKRIDGDYFIDNLKSNMVLDVGLYSWNNIKFKVTRVMEIKSLDDLDKFAKENKC